MTAARISGLFYFEIFDDHIGQQLAAHFLKVLAGNAGIMFDLDQPPRPNIHDPRKTKPFERVVYGLSLRIKHTVFQGYKDAGFHERAVLIAVNAAAIGLSNMEARGERCEKRKN
jgi:hypothetical protein